MVDSIVGFQPNISVHYEKKTLHVERSTSYQGYDGDEFIISKDTLNEVYHRFP